MRHRNIGRQLSRNSSHRAAMFRNMVASLVEHESMVTTVAKAKELRRVIEPLITIAKNQTDSVAARRLVYNRVRNRDTVQKLFNVLANRFRQRPGGYVRILKYGYRPGDSAPLAYVEFVDKAESSTTD